MSKHTVGMDALDIVLSLQGPGTDLGDGDVVPAGQVALVIETRTDAVFVTGTPQQLRQHILDGLALPVPDGVSLVDPA